MNSPNAHGDAYRPPLDPGKHRPKLAESIKGYAEAREAEADAKRCDVEKDNGRVQSNRDEDYCSLPQGHDGPHSWDCVDDAYSYLIKYNNDNYGGRLRF